MKIFILFIVTIFFKEAFMQIDINNLEKLAKEKEDEN
jgi:hypothetical protein